jgi:hypothetical protein
MVERVTNSFLLFVGQAGPVRLQTSSARGGGDVDFPRADIVCGSVLPFDGERAISAAAKIEVIESIVLVVVEMFSHQTLKR